jgi:hypothetical protein
LERAGLDLFLPPPPPPHTHTVFISHPQTSRLTDSVWGAGGRIGVRGRGNHAPTLQVGRVTDSDGGGRVRVGGLELGLGGGATTPQRYLELERSN